MILGNILLFLFICLLVADSILVYWKIQSEKERRKKLEENWLYIMKERAKNK